MISGAPHPERDVCLPADSTPLPPGGGHGADSVPEDPFFFLEEEARRVAGAMAEIRRQCLSGFNGHPAEGAPDRTAWDVPPQGPRGPVGFSPFYYFPFLFAGAFPWLRRDNLRTLCLSNRVLLEAVLLQDRQIDESRPWTPEDLYLLDSYHHRAMEMLLPLFPPDHPFWARTERCFTRYARAVLREQFRHRHRLSPYGEHEFLAVSAGKVALIRTTLHAMADLSGQRRFLSPLLASQTLFLVGFQAFDDLKDWKQDLRDRHFTHLLTRVLFEGAFQDRVERDDVPSVLEVGTVLYCRGIAADQLLRAERLFERALWLCRDAPVPLWKEVVRGFSKSCRDMRNDFAEIHRRTFSQGSHAPVDEPAPDRHKRTAQTPCPAADAPREDIQDRIRQGLWFLERNQAPGGGFGLLCAGCAYLNPLSRLSPSRGVTRLVLRSLSPMTGIHPPLGPLLQKAEQWLAAPPALPDAAPGLPGFFEAAFRPGIEAPEQDLPTDGTVPPPSAARLNGLFWTDQAYLASRRGLRLFRLETMAARCVRSSDYAPWYRTHPARHRPAPGVQAACRPFLPLFLLLQAPGPALFRPPLLARVRDHLLGRLRISGGWGNPTDTALHLLCLLTSGHEGNERCQAVDKLLQLQESDGSWAPNAFYKQDDRYFGSRELTTAWCLLCLFLDTVRPGPPPGEPAWKGHAPGAGSVRFLPHPGVPPSVTKGAEALLERHAALLPRPDHARVSLGTWDSMPAHFLLPHGETILIGINLLCPLRPPFRSTAMRPYPVEIVLGLFLGARVDRLGPLNDRLERIYVLGLALCACRRIWPDQPFHQLGGMSPLEERWCREHDPYLWSRVRAFLLHPEPGAGSFRWLLSCSEPARHGSIPRGAALYLGYGLFTEGTAARFPTTGGEWKHLLAAGREEILKTFRSRAGLDPTTHSLLRRSFREANAP